MKARDGQGHLEAIFEYILWGGRWFILLAVIGGMLTSFIMFYISSVDVFHLAQLMMQYASLENMQARVIIRGDLVGHAVEIIDGFLLAIVLLIFSYGIFELYISKIIQAYGSNTARHLLRINSLDDLKTRLGKVILMILVVKFFEVAVSLEFDSMEDMMKFAFSIILIGLTLFMNQLVEHVVHNRRSTDRGGKSTADPHPGHRASDS
ncbi:MAG: YqhA family protein [Mariprofundaceae bacterium]